MQCHVLTSHARYECNVNSVARSSEHQSHIFLMALQLEDIYGSFLICIFGMMAMSWPFGVSFVSSVSQPQRTQRH